VSQTSCDGDLVSYAVLCSTGSNGSRTAGIRVRVSAPKAPLALPVLTTTTVYIADPQTSACGAKAGARRASGDTTATDEQRAYFASPRGASLWQKRCLLISLSANTDKIVISGVICLEETRYLQANPCSELRSTEPKVGSSNLSGRALRSSCYGGGFVVEGAASTRPVALGANRSTNTCDSRACVVTNYVAAVMDRMEPQRRSRLARHGLCPTSRRLSRVDHRGRYSDRSRSRRTCRGARCRRSRHLVLRAAACTPPNSKAAYS
jgi:hypothetical protein